MPDAEPPHPSSAEARALRLANSPGYREPQAGQADEPPTPPGKSNRVLVATDDLRIDLAIVREDPEPVLKVRLADSSGGAAEDVALRLESARGDLRDARTDRAGRAEFPLPEGRARLVISGIPPVALTLRR